MRAILLLTVALLTAGNLPAATLAEIFGGRDAAFIVTDLDGNEVARLGGWRLVRRLSPCSTFKIPNTIVGLDTGVIPDARHVIRWDGTRHPIDEWNQDLDLRRAVAVSSVWYFQELARRAGERRMREYLRKFSYGNRDISGGLTKFWLESSLKLSAIEQVAFLRRLMKDALPASRRAQKIARELIVQERSGADIWAGKTGTAGDLRKKLAYYGWFVGYVVKGGKTYVYAANISKGENPSGRTARELVRKALVELGLWR